MGLIAVGASRDTVLSSYAMNDMNAINDIQTTPTLSPLTSLTNELARERNREAADRTLLAWIRTSLAMISLGFGLESLSRAAINFHGPQGDFPLLKAKLFGASLVLLGILATLAGMWEHRHVLVALCREDYHYEKRPAIAMWMGMSLVGVGLAALTAILFGF